MAVIGSVCARLEGLGSAAADVLKIANSYVSREHATHTAPADTHFSGLARDIKLRVSVMRSRRKADT